MGGVGQGTGRRQVTGALGGARGWFSRADAFSSPPDGWEPTGSVGRRETTGKLKREGRGEAETQVDRRGQTDTEGDAVPDTEGDAIPDTEGDAIPRIGTPRESGFFFFLPWFSECCLGPS